MIPHDCRFGGSIRIDKFSSTLYKNPKEFAECEHRNLVNALARSIDKVKAATTEDDFYITHSIEVYVFTPEELSKFVQHIRGV